MNRLLKIIATVIALIALIIIICIVLMILFINPNRFKPLIIKQIYTETGRTLTMPGDITWSFFPTISITTDSITLSNPAGYAQQVFVHADHAKAEVRLFPLLSGNVEPKNIIFSGAKLYLIKNKLGEENWNQWGTKSPSAQADTGTKTPTTPTKSSFSILLPNINITNSEIRYSDETKNQSFTLSNLNLQAKKVHLNTPFPVVFNTDFSSKNPDMNGHVNLNAIIIFDKKSLAINNIALTAQISAAQTNNKIVTVALSGNTSFSASRVSLQPINVQIANLNINGYLTLNNLNQPQYTGAINIKSFNACDFLKNFNINTRCDSENVLKKLELSTIFSGNQKQFYINSFDARIDNSSITGKFNLDDLATQTGKFSLYLSHVNVDSYLNLMNKTQTNTTVTDKTVTHSQTTNTIQLPEVVKGYNIAGNISAKDLTVNKIHFDSLDARLVAHYGFINLYPLSANLYHGKLSGALSADFRPLQPLFDIRLSLEKIDLQPMLSDVVDFKNASGTLTLNTNLTTHGTESQSLKEHLNGQATINLLDGAVKNMDIGYYFQSGLALIHGKKPAAKQNNITNIGSLHALFNIENGIARNDDLNLTSHEFTITGNGTVNLPNNTLNYLLHVNDRQNDSIPLIVSGQITSLSVRLDVEQAVKQNAEKQIKNQLQNKLKNALGGLGF